VHKLDIGKFHPLIPEFYLYSRTYLSGLAGTLGSLRISISKQFTTLLKGQLNRAAQ
jgi:hypothetical protein